MFEENDEKYILRLISQNQTVLFLGAGFSFEAKNSFGSNTPTGKKLCELLWGWLKYDGEYDGTTLADMYQATLDSGRKHEDIVEFLSANLLCKSIPAEYEKIVGPFWYRIYTTNIDNLLEDVYRRVGIIALDVLSYPKDDVRDRDQFLDSIQLIHLNGKLPCLANEITFSVRQYAQRSFVHDPLYEQFVRDYATLPTVFIGTELNEPLFWQYMEKRNNRENVAAEYRPKSFLISPKISQPKRQQLKALNIIPVESTTLQFLEWLRINQAKLPSKKEIIQQKSPTYEHLVTSTDGKIRFEKDLKEFSQTFHEVPLFNTKHSERSHYLMGASPKWEDIHNNLDAPRQLTGNLLKEIDTAFTNTKSMDFFAIVGSAGCGKSTILRRFGLSLAQAGRSVFITNTEELPRPNVLAKVVEALNKKVVLLFDNTESSLGLLPAIAKELCKVEIPPIIVIASRANEFDRRIDKFDSGYAIHEHSVHDLNSTEIDSVISILEVNNLLGRLKGMNQEQRRIEFSVRAHKQILVAMREATSGKLFDEIIFDEFKVLDPREAQILYLCVALATEAGYRLTKQEFVGCSEAKPAESLYILERTLKDIVVRSGESLELLLLRHRRIAEYMVENAAPRPLLREAYMRLLCVLSENIAGKPWRSRDYRFYRNVINHHTIFARFTRDVDEARSIYDSLSRAFKGDAQFWLQYGSLELEAGSLDYAENYIDQAESLDPGNPYIRNTRGNLLLKKSVVANTKSESLELRDEGSALLLDKYNSEYEYELLIYHIYSKQRLAWMHKWMEDVKEMKAELEHLRSFIFKGVERFPHDRELARLKEQIEYEYFSLATKR